MLPKPLSTELFIKNRTKLADKLASKSVAIVNANDEMPRNGDQYFLFRQNSDLFYLTGINQEKTLLLLCPESPSKKLKEILFILKPNPKMEAWYGHRLTKKEATQISGIKTVKYLEELDAALNELMGHSNHVYINANEYPKFRPEVISRDLRFTDQLKKEYPSHTFKRLAPLLTSLRLQKEADEINQIKNACHLTGKTFERILRFVKPGVTEYEIQAEMSHEFTRHLSKFAYHPIIATGKNALILHYNENKDTCKNGDLLLMDFGAEVNNYASDCTRTIPVNGKFTERQRACYDSVLRVQQKVKKMYVVGNTIEKINKEVLKLMQKELLNLGLLSNKEIADKENAKSNTLKFLMHGVAHYMGLDVHDVGSKYEPLKPGMVLTCEPGLYIREENFGIRIENDILITEKGPVDLMEHIPSDPDTIGEMMNLAKKQ